jgi:hypothetical protein
MTLETTSRRRTGSGTVVLVVAGGCALLTARPLLVSAADHPTFVLGSIFAVLTIAGLALPIPKVSEPTCRLAPAAALVVGIALFACGRLMAGGRPSTAASLTALVLNAFAAIAEEVWFRRLLFGWLAPAGTTIAIVGSATLFALVHVTTYGVWVLPLDVAVGLMLGWQRAATGSWRVPAVTHVVANILALW